MKPIDYVVPVKSIGHGITCTADLLTEDEVYRVMIELSQDIGHRLRLHKLAATGVQITIKNGDLSYRQYQAPLAFATQSPQEISLKGKELFSRNYNWAVPVRAVTIRAINLVPQGTPLQTSLYFDSERVLRRERLEDTIEDIRRRFGSHAIYSAACMGDLKMPEHRDHEVIMPSMMYQ